MKDLRVRHVTLDRLRTLFLLLMLVDHTLHGYAYYWGRFWFVHDAERDVLYDVLYLHNNSVIIPMLFFVSGQCVYESWLRHGTWRYVLRRFSGLMIPGLLGVVFLVPWMSYGKYVNQSAGLDGFWTYITQSFFTGKTLQAGPMWVLYVLFFHSVLAVFVLHVSGRLRIDAWQQKLLRVLQQHFVYVVMGVMGGCILLLGLSDLRWGAPWWIGWGKIFHVQGSRFLVQWFFFWLGVVFGLMPDTHRTLIWEQLARHMKKWMAALVCVGMLYISYAIGWIDSGAYTDEIYFHFLRNQGWDSQLWALIQTYAPGVWMRTTLHGIFLPLQILVYTLWVHQYRQRSWGIIDTLGPIGLGVFLFHPIFVIWMQIGLNGASIPAFVKIGLTVPIALWGSVLLSKMLRVPYAKWMQRI